jgi:biotin operon repressor
VYLEIVARFGDRASRRSSTRARSAPLVSVLDADPDLGRRFSASDFGSARVQLLAPVCTRSPGVWRLDDEEVGEDGLGLLVIDGVLRQRVMLDGRARCELVGAGDLLRTRRDDEHGCIAIRHDWKICRSAVVAVLDAGFTSRLAAWPSVLAEIVDRAAVRAHRLSLGIAIANVSGVGLRIQLLFWHLADRWGHVEPAGVVLALSLGQETVGELIGVSRSRVNMALRELEREGALQRHPSGWLLSERPPEQLLTRYRTNRMPAQCMY